MIFLKQITFLRDGGKFNIVFFSAACMAALFL